MKCEHRKGGRGINKPCNNKAVAKISFDFARWDWDYKRKPYGNRIKKIPCCGEHLQFQEENQYIMNLEVEKI